MMHKFPVNIYNLIDKNNSSTAMSKKQQKMQSCKQSKKQIERKTITLQLYMK